MMSGNGTSKKKIATKAAAAMRDHDPVLERAPADRARTASSTIASTAAFRPKNSAATMPTLPKAA